MYDFMKPLLFIWFDCILKSFNKGLIKIVYIKVFMHVFLFCVQRPQFLDYIRCTTLTLRLLITIKINSLIYIGSEKIVRLKNPLLFIYLDLEIQSFMAVLTFMKRAKWFFIKVRSKEIRIFSLFIQLLVVFATQLHYFFSTRTYAGSQYN